jgi:hypothetical protein
LSLGAAALPFKSGMLLIDPVTMLLIPMHYGLDGGFKLSAKLPASPAFVGAKLYLQAFAFNQPGPVLTRCSNGLKLALCSW